MQSEWLVEIPADFETNWVALPVPVGRRSLVRHLFQFIGQKILIKSLKT